MQRRRLLAAAPFGLAALARPALAQTPPPLQWQLASDFVRAEGLMAAGADYLSRRVAALTDNRFQIVPSNAGQPVPAGGVLAAVKAGKVEMGYVRPALYTQATPALGFAGGMPFGLSARGQMAWLLRGGGVEATNAVLAAFKCLGIPAGLTGNNFGGWWRQDLKAAADLSGRKIAVQGPGASVLAQLGAQPQALAPTDLVAALQKGVVEAAFLGGPVDGDHLDLASAARIAYVPGWQAPAESFWAVIAQDKWRDLAPAYKAALQTACTETAAWMLALYDALSPASLAKLEKAGVAVKPLPPEVLAALGKAATAWFGTQAASDAAFKKILEPWQKFVAAENAWFALDRPPAEAKPAPATAPVPAKAGK